MTLNPLFPHTSDEDKQAEDKKSGYVLKRRHEGVVEPLHANIRTERSEHHATPPTPAPGANAAADLIRHKLENLYAQEPAAGQELREAKAEPPKARSKHQQFMYSLSTSGKSLAEIQTAWHNYYVGLPDSQKHQVWQEFYAATGREPSAYTKEVRKTEHTPKATVSVHQPVAPATPLPEHPVAATHRKRSVATIQKQIKRQVHRRAQAPLKAKQHLQAVAFGLSMGFLVLVVLLFGFFNEFIITPFIQPGRHASATPIILNTGAAAPSATPEVIIPKINVEIPVDYTETSINDAAVEKSLESGILHYPTTAVPGQQGNAAFFGHSSNNIFNPGKYKFAFVLLHELVPGDIFYLTYGGKIYSYKVFDKQIVEPSNVGVLNPVPNKTATAALITCDPPGTSLHRLVVWGEQVSPDPAANGAPPAVAPAASQPAQLADNGPTLWRRIWNSIF